MAKYYFPVILPHSCVSPTGTVASSFLVLALCDLRARPGNGIMGNTSSERAAMGQGEKAHRRDSRGAKEGDRPKILMDSPEDADIFHGEDMKASLGFG